MGTQRVASEKVVVEKMVKLYCRGQHRVEGLCLECQGLIAYAHERLDRCAMANEKPFCSKCRIHCYEPGRRAQIKKVMRYAGPRMLLHAPLTAVRHLFSK